MNIALSPKIQEMIQEKIDHGDYAGPDEVVEEALQLLETRDRKLNKLRSMLDAADAEIARGEYEDWSPALLAKMRARAIELAESGAPLDPDACS
jgi:putative addiction module CopG family antidote